MKAIYGVDPGYLVPALVSVRSLWRHTNQVAGITIYGEGFVAEEQELVHRFGDAWERSISIRDFDAQNLDEFCRTNKSRHPPISLLPLLLPNLEEGRCLFMDENVLDKEAQGGAGEAVCRLHEHGHGLQQPNGSCAPLIHNPRCGNGKAEDPRD